MARSRLRGRRPDAMTGFDPRALDAAIDEATGSGSIVGTVVIVAHRGEIAYRRAAGWADREARQAVRESDVFRLASLTKLVICIAALTAAERGALDLDTPVTRWLPWFTPRLSSAQSPVITIRHLMTHTAGLGYGFGLPGGAPYRDAGISDGMDDSGLSLAENLRRLAAVPLFEPPGTAWRYSLAIDVLGAVLESAYGVPLSLVTRRLVLDPLGL